MPSERKVGRTKGDRKVNVYLPSTWKPDQHSCASTSATYTFHAAGALCTSHPCQRRPLLLLRYRVCSVPMVRT